MEKIEIFLVDDHHLVRNAIKNMLNSQDDFNVIGEACNGKEAIEKLKDIKPKVILMDLNMPELNGVEATKIIKKDNPEIAIIMLTVSDTEISLSETLKAGATGYLLKDATPDKLFTTIRHVAKGGALVQDDLMLKLLNEFKKLNEQSEHTHNILTAREVEVLKLVAEGYNNKLIGDTLFISEKTVKNHLHNVYEKLEVKDRVQAITKARDKKLI
jgi:DNA-binding NarL/FixJ family response regulator